MSSAGSAHAGPLRASAQSPYARAIALTQETLQRRALQYRRLAIALVVALPMLAVVMVWQHDLRWLVFITWLPAAVMLLVIADLRSLHAWRSGILADWSDGSLRLDALTKALLVVPGLPAASLSGMLATLPAWPDDTPRVGLRPVLVQLQSRLDRAARTRSALRCAGCGLAGASICAAVMAGSWGWLMLLVAWPVTWATALGQRSALHACAERVSQAAVNAGLDAVAAAALLAQVRSDIQGPSLTLP